MKKYFVLSVLLLSACAGTAFDPEHRKNATYNVFEGGCSVDEYILAVDNKNSKDGWKSQREFLCKNGDLAEKNQSLDGKVYSKAEMKALAEKDSFTHNLFLP